MSDKLIKRYVSLVLWLYRQPLKAPYLQLLERIFRLRDHSGWAWTIKYLKGCLLAVQQKIAGEDNIHVSDNELRIGLKNSGLPILLPHLLRELILKKDVMAIRAILAILTVFKVIPVKGQLKLRSITDPFKGLSTTLNQDRMYFVFNSYFKGRGWSPNLYDKLGLQTLLPLRTAGPNGRPSILWATHDAFCLKAIGSSRLLTALQDVSLYFGSDIFRLWMKEASLAQDWKVKSQVVKLGKLALKLEPAGKVRVFAILDVWSQSILEPIHNHMFSILRSIPNDDVLIKKSPLRG